MDQGIFSTSAAIVANTDLAGAIRGFVRTTSVPYVMNGRIGDMPFYGYPLAGNAGGKAVMGAHFENVQVMSTGLTVLPNPYSIIENVIQVYLLADLGAINLLPNTTWYVERLKAA